MTPSNGNYVAGEKGIEEATIFVENHTGLKIVTWPVAMSPAQSFSFSIPSRVDVI